MPTEILMPALSPTMEEGKLAKWLVKEGQTIKAGDIIAEIETDKATMEVEAVDEGKVAQAAGGGGHRGREGQHADRDAAGRGREGRRADRRQGAVAAARQRRRRRAPRAPLGQGQRRARTAAVGGSPHPHPLPARREAAAHGGEGTREAPPAPNGHARIFASPLARGWPRRRASSWRRWRAAGRTGASSSATSRRRSRTARAQRAGQGRHGGDARRRAQRRRRSAPQPMPDDKILALYEKGSYEVVPHDGMRKVIAQRLTLSKQTIPHFYLTRRLPHRRAAARARAHERGLAQGRARAPTSCRSTTSASRRMALALAQVPAANVTWTEAGTLRHKYSDVGVAVAIEGGLFTPIIRHAELKSLSEISNEMRDLAERARKRRLAPHEYQGGTTSISNLGMYGIKSFDAVINPPHATILAVGAGEKRPIVIGDKVEVATIMSCTLSCDHRVVDGAVGAELLNAFKMLIEDPVRMLV